MEKGKLAVFSEEIEPLKSIFLDSSLKVIFVVFILRQPHNAANDYMPVQYRKILNLKS